MVWLEAGLLEQETGPDAATRPEHRREQGGRPVTAAGTHRQAGLCGRGADSRPHPNGEPRSTTSSTFEPCSSKGTANSGSKSCPRPATAQGALRSHRLREGLLPRLERRPDIFDLRGIDRVKGAMVVVRPDQYVSNVLPLDAFDELARSSADSCSIVTRPGVHRCI